GYACTTCIAAGTPVLLADGTSRAIDELPIDGGARVWGPDENGVLRTAPQIARIDQGLRDCVSLVLEDGRTLVCTPDHEIRRADGSWVRADRLELGRDHVTVAQSQGDLVEVGNRAPE